VGVTPRSSRIHLRCPREPRSQTLDLSQGIAIEEGHFKYLLPVAPAPIEISGTFVDDGVRVVGRIDLGEHSTDRQATNFAALTTDPAAAEAMCSADAKWIAAESAAYAAYDARDLDKADSLVNGDDKGAFISTNEDEIFDKPHLSSGGRCHVTQAVCHIARGELHRPWQLI
jgi:hypothetical protein